MRYLLMILCVLSIYAIVRWCDKKEAQLKKEGK